MQNFETLLAPRKQPDGSLVFAVPMTPQSKIALLDTKADYGAYVREVIEGESFGPGSDVLACAEELSLEEIVSQFNEGPSSFLLPPSFSLIRCSPAPARTVTGAKATYHQLAHDDFLAVAGPAGQEILEMLLWFQDFGCASRLLLYPSHGTRVTDVRELAIQTLAARTSRRRRRSSPCPSRPGATLCARPSGRCSRERA